MTVTMFHHIHIRVHNSFGKLQSNIHGTYNWDDTIFKIVYEHALSIAYAVLVC